jgi:hypothetical protein
MAAPSHIHRIKAHLFSYLFLFVFAGCTSRDLWVAGSNRDADSFRQITIGLCEDYPEESRSLKNARRDLEVLKTNNIRVLRIAFGWDAMEPQQGKYDWTFWDEFVRMAVDDYDIKLIPYVCYTPQWASRSDKEDFWKHPPRDNARFASFMRQIVSRYKDRIHSWELWNEPDNPAYWAGSSEEFAALITAGSDAVRAADPNCKVVSGGIAWNLGFLNELFEDHSASRFIDIVNLHNYYETWAPESLEQISDYVGNARNIIREHGNDQPIWMAEIGYSDFRRGNFVSEVAQARYDYEHTSAYQAASVGRAITLLAASEQVPLIAWYRINDLPQSEDIIGDVNNRHLGVLNKGGRPKPSLQALRFFNQLFSGGVRCLDERVSVSRKINSDSEVHFFEKQNGEVLGVMWLRPRPRHRDQDGASDLRQERIAALLPLEVAPVGTIYDELGVRTGTLRAASHRQSSHVNDIVLRGGELQVLVFNTRERANPLVSSRARGTVVSLAE